MVDAERASGVSPGRVTGRELIAIFAAASAGGAAVATRIGWHPALAGLLVAVQGGVWLAVVDLRVQRLPVAAVGAITAMTAILLGLAAYLQEETARLLPVLGGAAAMRLVYRVNQASIGGMGAGDLRLAYLLGGIGGWAGWWGWMAAAVVPFVLSALGGGLMLLLGRRRGGEPVPFGPAVALGMVVAVLLVSR
ncbi:A24 family peptidase [Frankia sp. AgKG'84/4]|uniref:hypothetical protein n=1 Tax=Frankia sp. AgKG'84/4 TaxID=573490 RepID=UPI00200D7ACC|nr:hypothetical protein [Frankia sp. AgKG'84/4]MCL9793860.1 hypothetical protein [Frankia sp. AgKG'84/4]